MTIEKEVQRNSEDIKELFNHASVANHEMSIIKEDISVIKTDIKWMKEKLDGIKLGVPQWFAIILPILTAILAGLVIWVLTH